MASTFTGNIHTSPSGTVVTEWENVSGTLWYMNKLDVRMHQGLYEDGDLNDRDADARDDLYLAELYLRDHNGWWPHL